MTEETEQPRDPESGQFKPAVEGFFGKDREERESGFVPMTVTPPEQDNDVEFTADDAVQVHSILNETAEPAEPDLVVRYQDPDGDPIADNRTVSIEEAAADLTKFRENRIESAAKSISDDFASAIDSLRSEAVQGDPKVAEAYGVEVPADEAKEKQKDPGQPGTTLDPSAEAIDAIDGLTAETKQALKNPQVRQALDQQFAEVDRAREQYANHLQTGNQMLQATVAALAPELGQIPLERWPEAITLLAQVDPARANLLNDTLTKWSTVAQAQAQAQQWQQQEHQRQFEAQRQAYSAAADKALGPMTTAEKLQMSEDLVSYLEGHGISRDALAREAQTNLAIHHPGFQAMAADAIRYQRLMKAPAKATREVPRVSRPGYAGAAKADPGASLQARFASASGDDALRLAAKIAQARRR